MKPRFSIPSTMMVSAVGAIAALSLLLLTVVSTAAQNPAVSQTARYVAPRAPDRTGKPNLNGIWQAMNTANWDLLDHPARKGPVPALGAAFSQPGGLSVVEGNEIPYRPEALAKKKENAEHWMAADPELKCYLPGVPRATYMPYPFEVAQGTPAELKAQTGGSTLEEAFLALTGSTIRDEQASGLDQMRNMAAMWRRGRR